jgi:hypothetical protein
VDLPPIPVRLPPPPPAIEPVPEEAPGPLDTADLPEAPTPAAPAAAGDHLVARIRELTDLYRAGALDDEEFAAAKALVLRDHTG